MELATTGTDPLSDFHPIIQRWFRTRLGDATEPQKRGWPLVRQGRDVLIAAPTGSGKTLAAFLAAVDRLFRQALEGTLRDETSVLYVSPLKALGNDVQKNLLKPLEEIYALAREEGLEPKPIRVMVRSGDTPAKDRQGMVKRPPHILITTPESLYLYLTAQRSRETIKRVRSVIVDEIHALARDKRGSHFSLSMERLKALTEERPQLIGLSATQKPLPAIAAFLTGTEPAKDGVAVVEVGHLRPWEISVETPDEELSAVATHEMWGHVYDRLVQLAEQYRTVLLFTNTRRLAERIAHDLGERLGKDKVSAHHGSMSKTLRLAAEEKLKSGQLRMMVATASLELGIDIGSIDVVAQVGSSRSIAVCLQRVGRAGHFKGGLSRGVIFALTRDELVEVTALTRAIKEGDLDAVRIPQKPLDILAQQLVAACAAQDWAEDELFALCRRAYPYRDLTREEFNQVVEMLAEGVATQRGRVRAHVHRDRVNGNVKGRKGARITALTNGGAIPETFSYPVIAEPDDKQVGTLDEDFAVESMAGDIFVLGSTSWQIQSVRAGQVRVVDAHGAPPTVPFWVGEAPSRTDELSAQVARLREDVVREGAAAVAGLGLQDAAVDQLIRYLRASANVLGGVPSKTTLIAERFFDEAGGMQLVIHAPLGGRINRAWGLALRKSFCRTFDFELQAAATDDGIVLSLGEQHSFPLMDIFAFVTPNSVERVLTQAVLQSPLFPTRFRWDAQRALALPRYRGGKKIPPQIQRARAEDLMAAVFPAQVGCQDNHGGAEVELPDHPLTKEAMFDCLHEAMDLDGLKQVLQGIKDGSIRCLAVDLPEPSPLSHQLLNSAPYTYLDDAPLEERRARAVALRRTLPAEDAASFGALDASAIEQVVADAQPLLRDVDELHDTMLQLVLFPEAQAPRELAEGLIAQRRAARLEVGGRRFLVPAERVQHARALFPGLPLEPALEPLPGDGPVAREVAALAVVRGRVEIDGPTTTRELAEKLGLATGEVEGALAALESQGQVLRGTFRPNRETAETEWCDRRLLQRIHRLTVGRLRKEVEPLSAQDYMRFLFRWHHFDEPLRGTGGLLKAVSLLQGYEAPAAAWEVFLLPQRMKQYFPELLEKSCFNGEVAWGRLTLRAKPVAAPGPKRGVPAEPVEPGAGPQRGASPNRNANITFVRREELDWMLAAARPGVVLSDGGLALPEDLSHAARDVAQVLERRGASFFADLVSGSRRLQSEVEDALWELLAHGLVTADALENLRVLQSPKRRKRQKALRRGGPGRWSLMVPAEPRAAEELHERTAKLFLQRYGIVWRDLVLREPLAPSWRELSFIYRRMEARGEIRGGRFLSGFAGEQFALPEAVDMARSVRRAPLTGHTVHLSAVDPLNLTGIATPGPRVPAMMGNFITYVDGAPAQAPAGAVSAET